MNTETMSFAGRPAVTHYEIDGTDVEQAIAGLDYFVALRCNPRLTCPELDRIIELGYFYVKKLEQVKQERETTPIRGIIDK